MSFVCGKTKSFSRHLFFENISHRFGRKKVSLGQGVSQLWACSFRIPT
nr:MAG TPA: hypothetical protein [Caudoviricetes sp.]